MRKNDDYNISFRCYFPNEDGARFTTHYQRLSLRDLPRWLEAYQFTHPTCLSVTCKVWFTEQEAGEDCD